MHCLRPVAHGILHITEIELHCAHCMPILHFSRSTLHRNIIQAMLVLHAFFAYCVPAIRAIVAHACVTLQCSLAMTGFSKFSHIPFTEHLLKLARRMRESSASVSLCIQHSRHPALHVSCEAYTMARCGDIHGVAMSQHISTIGTPCS